MASPLTGPSSKNRDNVGQIATVNGTGPYCHGLDVVSHSYVQLIASDAVEASSTVSVINATAHSAQIGDIIRFTSGTHQKNEVVVYQTATNTITLAQELSAAPSTSDAFDILRHTSPVVASDGQIQVDVDVSAANLAFQSDDAGSGTSYFGYAAIGTATSAASWQIKKLVDTAGDLAMTWADGDASYDNIWDNRAALSYS